MKTLVSYGTLWVNGGWFIPSGGSLQTMKYGIVVLYINLAKLSFTPIIERLVSIIPASLFIASIDQKFKKNNFGFSSNFVE
ncbi:MAG: hypothetical protein ACW99A_17490 [Candidatus Kariarchaeaceae archaeon]